MWSSLVAGAGDDWLPTWARIANEPAQAEALKASLPLIAEAARPASDEQVVAPLMRLMTVFGVADRSTAEWTTYLEVYVEVLSGLSAWAIERGAFRYVSRPDSEFFPKPGPLRAECEVFERAMQRALTAAQVIASTPALGDDPADVDRKNQIAAIHQRWLDQPTVRNAAVAVW